MVKRCSCCHSQRSVQPWRVSHGFESICDACHRERRDSAKPRRNRTKSKKGLCQMLFPFMNEKGPVLCRNNQAKKEE
jgi:hypothetical protein